MLGPRGSLPAQHADVVERLMSPNPLGDLNSPIFDFDDIGTPDASLISELFPSLWDTFQPP